MLRTPISVNRMLLIAVLPDESVSRKVLTWQTCKVGKRRLTGIWLLVSLDRWGGGSYPKDTPYNSTSSPQPTCFPLPFSPNLPLKSLGYLVPQVRTTTWRLPRRNPWVWRQRVEDTIDWLIVYTQFRRS